MNAAPAHSIQRRQFAITKEAALLQVSPHIQLIEKCKFQAGLKLKLNTCIVRS